MNAVTATVTSLYPRAAAGRINVGGGVELSYIDRGAGPAMVFIPGWTFTKDVFSKQIEYFENFFRVISYDPRGQGASTFSLEGNDYMTHAEDLAALLNALKVTNPILVGWGSGALTAWGFVKQQGPGAIAANIVIDQSPKCLANNDRDWVMGTVDQLAATHTMFLRNKPGHAQYIKRYIETDLFQGEAGFDDMSWLAAQSMLTNSLVAAQLFACAMFTDLSVPAMAAARLKPTLFFIAEHWSTKAVPFVRRMMPEVRIDVFGAHMMFWEFPDRFNQSLHGFLQQHCHG
jgi:pimeloyl-ACP methyl ester carboxylesterase